jgi:hypothetical protein
MDDAVVVLLVLVSCALITLKLIVVVISSVIDSATMTATTANMDFIAISAGKLIVRYIIYDKACKSSSYIIESNEPDHNEDELEQSIRFIIEVNL